MTPSAFLIIFIALIALMALIPFLLRQLEIPQVIALLITGMLIGPSGIDLIGLLSQAGAALTGAAAESARATAGSFSGFMHTLGSLGLVFLMALAGMEADFKLIRAVRLPVAVLSCFTFFIPAAAGYFVYAYFRPFDFAGKLLYASLFASHSVGIAFPVIRDLKLSRSRFGATVLISTILTDIASILLLAVSVQLYRETQCVLSPAGGTLSLFDRVADAFSSTEMLVFFLVIVLAYLVFTTASVGFIGRRILKYFRPGEDMLITIILAVILGAVVLGELCGINLVVGAFIAGLALARFVKGENALLFRRFESIGYGFLIPFLFISIGMSTDLSVFTQGAGALVTLFTVGALISSKTLSGYLALRVTGFSHSASLAAGLMTVPQLSATLAAAAIGRELGILSPVFFNSIIVLSIVTTLPVPTLVRVVLRGRENRPDDAADFEVPQVLKEEELL